MIDTYVKFLSIELRFIGVSSMESIKIGGQLIFKITSKDELEELCNDSAYMTSCSEVNSESIDEFTGIIARCGSLLICELFSVTSDQLNSWYYSKLSEGIHYLIMKVTAIKDPDAVENAINNNKVSGIYHLDKFIHLLKDGLEYNEAHPYGEWNE